MKRFYPRLLLACTLVLSFALLYVVQVRGEEYDCFSILVGRYATIDGSVLFGHNEDDSGDLLVDWYKVPAMHHNAGEFVMLKNGGRIEQVRETYGFLWLEMPGQDFADSYMNEWGVTIASNQCTSKETSGELVDGGIGYYLRRIMAERAKTAREAVEIAGRIIENVGYCSSGRSYCIADPNEAWILSVVRGKHWVAERVPDDEVAVIPNYYTITRVDLGDTANFLGCADLVDYAVQKGWYDPASGKEFNFREAYSSCRALNAVWNIPRNLQAVNLLSGKHYGYDDRLPFSFKPARRLSAQDIVSVLENHYEGTEFEMNPAFNHGNPHRCAVTRICSNSNRYGFVAQLRGSLPGDIGNVFWIAPRRPCIQPFVPWYYGIDKIPPSYSRGDFKKALSSHFNGPKNLRNTARDHAYWYFNDYAAMVDRDYGALIGGIKKEKLSLEKQLFVGQAAFERKVLALYRVNPRRAKKMLTDYTSKFAEEILGITRQKLGAGKAKAK
ncbi:MAG: hypothetical protein B6D63_00750 [Candidatus Latescibacteria bacterium 4484_7]|nr:MAG: hypothetical protein B6D63_00750 [Candidatus Latescibacteria bacterium 4484_7]